MTFNLNEYSNPEKDNAKIKSFIDFVIERFSDEDYLDNIYLSLLNEDDFIDSLEYYIVKNNVTAQITALNYITYVTNFYKMLSAEYSIKNDVFSDLERNEKFMVRVKRYIERLKPTNTKEIATDEQYEEINMAIDTFFIDNEDLENSIYDEMAKDFRTKNSKYIRLVSILAVKLASQYGISNQKLVTFEVSDVDIENGLLNINGYTLPLDEKTKIILSLFIKIRNQIIRKHSIDQKALLVKLNGQSYLKSYPNREKVPDNETLFIFLKDTIGTYSVGLFSDKRILEMLKAGISINTITDITECSSKRCAALLRLTESHKHQQDELVNFLTKKVTVQKKDYFKCPCCGREKRSISKEWVLAQYDPSGEKHLVCNECRGLNSGNIHS